jgi:uncharacterized membrane protein
MADVLGEQSVIAVSFADDSNAYEALTRLKELDAQRQISTQGIAVVVRGDDGRIAVKDELGGDSMSGTYTGGLVGLLIGVLGGPLGILLGGATGLLIGSLFDAEDAEETESALSEVSKSVQIGRTALVADVGEPSPEVIDAAMARLNGTVVRRSLDEVEAEIAAAENAQRAAKREARKELVKARHEKDKREIHAKIEELKSKLGPHKKAATMGS